ncbi:hypothetical protein ACOME3_004218 [Neoechinorhynchus agilis]
MCFYEIVKFSIRITKVIGHNTMDLIRYVARKTEEIIRGVLKYVSRVLNAIVNKTTRLNNVLLLLYALAIFVVGLMSIFEPSRLLLSSHTHNLDVVDILELVVGLFGLQLYMFLIFIALMTGFTACSEYLVAKLRFRKLAYVCIVVSVVEIIIEGAVMCSCFALYKVLQGIVQHVVKFFRPLLGFIKLFVRFPLILDKIACFGETGNKKCGGSLFVITNHSRAFLAASIVLMLMQLYNALTFFFLAKSAKLIY